MVGAVLVATFGLLGSAGSKWVTVRAGIGLREAIVGQTTRSDLLKGSRTAEYYAGQGLWFSFREDDRLIAVTIMGSKFRTEKGVRIGSTQETVAKAYGTPHLGDLPLPKDRGRSARSEESAGSIPASISPCRTATWRR